MLRKFGFLAFALVTLAGFTLASSDDDSPTGKLMKEINDANKPIQKATRNASEYAKGASKIPEHVTEIVKLAKEARDLKEPAEHAKKPLADYQKSMDEMIKSAEVLSKLVSKPGTKQQQAKEAYNTYYKTCTACHDVFKKDE
jgi:cytochrome c556